MARITSKSRAVAATTRSTVGYAGALGVCTLALRRHAATLHEPGEPATIHGFRVALRTLRSLFKAAKEFIDVTPRAHFRTEFGWLSQRSAPVRDLDVLLAALPGYLAGVPDSAQRLENGLVPMLATTRASYDADLRTALNSARYRTLVRDWQAMLNALRTSSFDAPAISVHVQGVLARRHRALLKFRRRQVLQAEVLHAFRKDCKQLRYILEAFQSLFAPVQMQAALDACKKVQTLCGERWDVEVHAALLGSVASRVQPPLAASDLTTLMNALTITSGARSTLAVQAIKDFQRTFEVPELCPPLRVPSEEAG